MQILVVNVLVFYSFTCVVVVATMGVHFSHLLTLEATVRIIRSAGRSESVAELGVEQVEKMDFWSRCFPSLYGFE